MKDDAFYLRHILESIGRVEEDTAAGVASFRGSKTIQDAVVRNLQVLSESCQRLSPALKSRWPQVEWGQIAAFRNVLVHDYLGLDMDQIWKIVQSDVPRLKQTVEGMLREIR
ncbi:MAG TPA: DUF86 domain-containing protein [Bryobacteraceae bacterium]|nr:DUF86 domain-containing protein [Bryobacteraceae bacterium]